MTKSGDLADQREVVVKIDSNCVREDVGILLEPSGGCGSKIWRESSYHFWKDGGPMAGDGGNSSKSGGGNGLFQFQQRTEGGADDPATKLIGQFLYKQRASGKMSLDMDLEMEELRGLPPVSETESPINQQVSSRELKVSSQDPSSAPVETVPEPIRRRHKDSSNEVNLHHRSERSEVLKCTSNVSFRGNSSLLRTKTNSRLMDPPEEHHRRSGRVLKSVQMKSGMLGKSKDDEEDDPFFGEDLPEEFKKENLSALTLIQWVSLILIVGVFVCSLMIPFLKNRLLWELHLWKWEVLILVLICGRLFSGWGIRIVVFFINRNFLLRKRVLYFVYGLKRAVQNCLWLGLVLIAWHYMFDKKVERETRKNILPYVTKILVCLLVGTLIWLVKTLLVKVLGLSFHVSTFFDRIQESLFNQYVIETLSGPPLIEIERTQEEEEEFMVEVWKLQKGGATIPADLREHALPTNMSGWEIGSGGLQRSPKVRRSFQSSGAMKKDEGITIDQLHKLNQKNISAWNMKRLMNIVRYGVLSTLDGRIPDATHEDESAMQIRRESEAKAAAKKIFHNVAELGSKKFHETFRQALTPRDHYRGVKVWGQNIPLGRSYCSTFFPGRYIYLEDLMRFMREDEALKTMNLFEGASESKKISKSVLENWMVNAFRERRALALTLNDTKTAVNTLYQVVNVVVGIIIMIIWLLILEIATTHFLVFMSSQLLLAVFIFGNTCKTIFEAIIFLFVMHPFDVGDRCEIEGVQMVVEEMNILTTVFLRYDNQKIIYPNSILATKPVSNYYRSPHMGDAIEFSVHISTSMEKITLMKERIIGHIERKKDHWYPAPMVVLKEVEDMNRLRIEVWLTHRMNHQDMGERWARRALLIEEMIKVFRDLDVEYRMLPRDVNVRNMPPLNSTRLPSNWGLCTN